MKEDLQIPAVLIRGSAVGRHNRVSPCGVRGPCSNPAVLKCPRTGRSKNCRPVRSSLLGSFLVGPPGPPDRCEHWFDLDICHPFERFQALELRITGISHSQDLWSFLPALGFSYQKPQSFALKMCEIR